MIMWIKIAVIGASALIGLASVYIFKMKQDNPVEEVTEEVIKKESGIDIDLTPLSPDPTTLKLRRAIEKENPTDDVKPKL